MTNLREIYKCEVCGNVVEIIHQGQPALKCCEQAMIKLEAKTEDTGNEKHVPIIEESEKGITVKVGSVEHPMLEEHYIKCIEILTDKKVYRKELNPGDIPEATFCCLTKDMVVEVREYCTIHGLWKNV